MSIGIWRSDNGGVKGIEVGLIKWVVGGTGLSCKVLVIMRVGTI